VNTIHPPRRSTIHTLKRAVLSVLAVSILSQPLAGMSASELPIQSQSSERASLDPFEWFGDIPDEVDAAAVFNNPAQRFLLNESGRSLRKLLAISGMFSQSEHAWDALASAFETDADETIRALLGKRVVVVWDGIGSSSNSFFGLAKEVDTRWTLVSEVDPAYLREIRSHLKPVRRRIQSGQAVYAIEQGRYEIVLLKETSTEHDASFVILAPRGGAALLDHVLGSFVDAPARANANAGDNADDNDKGKFVHRSLLQDREQLAQSLSDDMGIEADWSMAWAIQLDRVLGGTQAPTPKTSGGKEEPSGPQSNQERSTALLGVMSPSPRGIHIAIATDFKVESADTSAPIGLLSAVGGDALLAIAMAQTPALFANEQGIEINQYFGAHSQSKTDASNPGLDETEQIGFFGGPGIVLVSDVPDNASPQADPDTPQHLVAMSMMVQLPAEQEEDHQDSTPAQRIDRMMQGMLKKINPSQTPQFDGQFPTAIRSHTIDFTNRPDHKETSSNSSAQWPGDQTRISWLASEVAQQATIIASMGPQGVETARQVRWIAEAAKTLDAIPRQQSPEEIITSGYIRPSRLISLIDSSSAIDLAISKLIDRVDWTITRAPFGLRGSSTIAFTDFAAASKLGNDQNK
jgi:hypothetical protein